MPSSCSTCFPLTVFSLLCFPVIGSWENVEPQSLSLPFREWSLTPKWHSNCLGTRKLFDTWRILPTHVHISQEIILAFRKTFYLILVSTLPKYSSFVSMWNSRCFNYLGGEGEMRCRLSCVWVLLTRFQEKWNTGLSWIRQIVTSIPCPVTRATARGFYSYRFWS